MIVNIYLETSIKGPGRRDGYAGYVLEAPIGEPKSRFGPVKGVTMCEAYLKVFKHALMRITKPCDICVWTDSTYLSGAFEQGWIQRWQQSNWKKSDGTEVANRTDWQEVIELLKERKLEFRINERHSFKSWMESECKRRAEICMKNLESSTP